MTKQERAVLEQMRDTIETILSLPPEPESVTETELRKSIEDRDAVIARLQKQLQRKA